MTTPSRATTAGRVYLDLRKKARSDRRPVDELLQLYVLEAFLARLAESPLAELLVLKGGVLLAAFGERRPTRDVELQAQGMENDADVVHREMCGVAARQPDDGVVFDVNRATAVAIRDEDVYAGVCVTLGSQLATAQPHFHVDVNVGDPIVPAPQDIRLPRLLGGDIRLRGYPLVMVLAEKIVTAIARGTVNTRWRDFADVYLLSRHHPVDGSGLIDAVLRVASHRRVTLTPLAEVLNGYGDIGQSRWDAWIRRQRIEDRVPGQFAMLLQAYVHFSDPAVTGSAQGRVWDPGRGQWT